MDLPALISALILGWPARAAHHEVELTERPAPVLSQDVKVPRQLIETLERDYKKENKHGEHVEVKQSLMIVTVELKSIKEGTLEDDARWVMAPGGGAFDFASSVQPHPGSFNLKFAVRDEAGAPITPSRIYSVPRSKVRTLDRETFGDGCNKVMDVTSTFGRRFRDGIDLYTAGQRYLSTVGGTFLIAAFGEKVLQVAHVTFTDSRYPHLICE